MKIVSGRRHRGVYSYSNYLNLLGHVSDTYLIYCIKIIFLNSASRKHDTFFPTGMELMEGKCLELTDETMNG
jgi:hypothetical protein